MLLKFPRRLRLESNRSRDSVGVAGEYDRSVDEGLASLRLRSVDGRLDLDLDAEGLVVLTGLVLGPAVVKAAVRQLGISVALRPRDREKL